MSDLVRPDLYRLLQVDPSAHPDVIKAAYRALLRAGKHPDVGGTDADAKQIIAAYQVLSDPERRRAYDRWLHADAASADRTMARHDGRERTGVPASGVGRTAGAPRGNRERMQPTGADAIVRGGNGPAPAGGRGPVTHAASDLIRQLRGLIDAELPGYRPAPDAPFASHFDLVRAGPAPFSNLLYIKTGTPITSDRWAAIFALTRAIRLARTRAWPSTDVVLLVPPTPAGLGEFLVEAARPRTRRSWNRLVVAVCTAPPLRIHVPDVGGVPRMLGRLQRRLVAPG